MNNLVIFGVRVILGIFFAVLLSRFFFRDGGLPVIAGLAVFLVGMAYVFEYFRRRKAD